MDIVDPATRSRMMRGIRGKNTRPERIVRSILHRAGFRFRLHDRNLPGKPDVILPKWRAVIFVNGCFWHGHGCHLFKMPTTRTEFWREKIRRNRDNDKKARCHLEASGWRVCTVWECAIKGKKSLDGEILTKRLKEWLLSVEDGTMTIEGITGEEGTSV